MMYVRTRYSIKKYILLGTVAATLGVWVGTILLSLIGFPTQGLLLAVLGCFPVVLFASLRGFHKGLVVYYGFREPQLDGRQESKKE